MRERAGVLVLVAAVVGGCATARGIARPTAADATAESTQEAAGRPTEISTGDPTYDGPPADAPASLGPLTTVRAVDLTPALPGPRLWADSAVAAPGGTQYVVLRDDDYTTYRLATVSPEGAVTAVPIPSMDAPTLFPTDDGTVLLAGRFRSTSQGGPGEDPDWGYQLVDPATGQGEQTVVVPYPDDSPEYAYQDAAVSPDGETLYLFVSWSPFENEDEPEPEDVTTLYAVDLGSGDVTERDLADDLDAVSVYDSGVYEKGLLARPDGGVTLAFDATPSSLARDPDGDDETATLPTLFFFDEDLDPDGDPVQLADLDDAAETAAVTGTPDGTVFVQLEDSEGVSVVAVPDAGGSGTAVAVLPGERFSFGLVVEPAQEQALIYSDEVAPLDLTTGQRGAPMLTDCAGQGVRDLYPGLGDVGALMLGECDAPAPRTQYLWVVTG